MVRPLQNPGIEEFQVRDSKHEVVERVNRNEREYFDPHTEVLMAPELEDFEYEGTYRIEKLSFVDRFKWTFSDGDMTFNASIEDESFRDQITSGVIAFRHGDSLRLRIRRRTTRQDDTVKTTFTVTDVLRHFPAPRQASLLSGELTDSED